MRFLALGGCAWVLASPTQAQVPLDLRWSAPADLECPTQAEVFSRVRAAGAAGGGGAAKALEAEARIETDGQGALRLELALSRDGATTRRTLTAHVCEALADAAVLLIALALDAPAQAVEPDDDGDDADADATTAAGSERVRGAASSDGSDDRATAATPSAPTRSSATIEDAPGAPDSATDGGPLLAPPELAVGLASSLSFAMLPASPAFGAALRLQLRLDPLRVGVTGQFLPYQSAPAAGVEGARVEGEALLLGVAPCYALAGRSASLSLCALVELGRVRARALDVTQPQEGVRNWLAAGGVVELGLGLTDDLDLSLALSLAAPRRLPRLLLETAEGDRVAFEASATVLRAMLGLDYVFR